MIQMIQALTCVDCSLAAAPVARARAAVLRDLPGIRGEMHLQGTQALVTTYGHQVSTVILFIYFVFVNSFPMVVRRNMYK